MGGQGDDHRDIMPIRAPGRRDRLSPDGTGLYHSAPPHPKDDGWMTARQAADRGHGTLLIDHIYPKFYSLRLMGGRSIIINTSATPDTAPT